MNIKNHKQLLVCISLITLSACGNITDVNADPITDTEQSTHNNDPCPDGYELVDVTPSCPEGADCALILIQECLPIDDSPEHTQDCFDDSDCAEGFICENQAPECPPNAACIQQFLGECVPDSGCDDDTDDPEPQPQPEPEPIEYCLSNDDCTEGEECIFLMIGSYGEDVGICNDFEEDDNDLDGCEAMLCEFGCIDGECIEEEPVPCTNDVSYCLTTGEWVGRSGPNCEFAC